MIETIAAWINYLIAALAAGAAVLAWHLNRRAREIPARMREAIRRTAKEWGAAVPEGGSDELMRVLDNLRAFVETADPERRAELKGFIRGGDGREDAGVARTKALLGLGRVFTEVFPLMGILGTVCALSATAGISDLAARPSREALERVLSLFGTAVSSTIYGLICAVVFMFVFGALEARLTYSFELVRRYRDLMDKALLIASTGRE